MTRFICYFNCNKSNTTGWLGIQCRVDIRFVHMSDLTFEKNMVLRDPCILYLYYSMTKQPTETAHFDWLKPMFTFYNFARKRALHII